tara:strand:- start:39211 stop:39777 length:567 start_codon:yes stop_codon:yes gene_type:complete
METINNFRSCQSSKIEINYNPAFAGFFLYLQIPFKIQNSMLEQELSFIKEHLHYLEKENVAVSKVSVGWHLDHSLKVINTVLDILKQSDTEEYEKKFNFFRFYIFLKGSFPRGKVKSPKRVLPPEIILIKALEEQIRLVENSLKNYPSIQENQFFTHPIFKQLNKKQTLKFLKLHSQHHFKIIQDILK